MSDIDEVRRRAAQLAAFDEQHLYSRYSGLGPEFGKAIVGECIGDVVVSRLDAELAGIIIMAILRLSRLQGDDVPRLLTDRKLLPPRIGPDFFWYRQYKNRAPITGVVVRHLRRADALLDVWLSSATANVDLETCLNEMTKYAAILAVSRIQHSPNSAWEALMAAFDAAMPKLPTSV